MAVSDFINRTLSPALKKYATPIQDAILKVAQDFLEKDYELIKDLPEIKRPKLIYDHDLTEVGSIYTYLDDTGKSWLLSEVDTDHPNADGTYNINPDSLDVLTSQETLYLIPTVSLSNYQVKTPSVEQSSYPMYQVDGYSVFADHSQVLDALASDYGFTVRTDATLEEQVKILADIAYSYRLRGSIWSIEHMKDLYGGNLPSPVDVTIPSYTIFRYSISEYDKTDKYQDGDANQPGVYEVWVYNWPGDAEELYNWMHDELVMAGAKIYIRDKILTGRTLESTDEGVVELKSSYPFSLLYNSRLFIDVVDTEGHIVALKPVDEYYYVKHIPETGYCRVLKNETQGSLPTYAVDIGDTNLTIQYAFTESAHTNPESIDWKDVTSLVAFAQTNESKPILWLRLSSDDVSPFETPVLVKDVGVDWYVVYRRTNAGIVEWMNWTSEDMTDPDRLVITTDPVSAEGILVRANLEGLKYPLCTYNKVEVRTNLYLTDAQLRTWQDIEALGLEWIDLENYPWDYFLHGLPTWREVREANLTWKNVKDRKFTWASINTDGIDGQFQPNYFDIGYGLLKSAKYSESGQNEYQSLGTLLAEVTDVGPIVRSDKMTDVLEVVMMKKGV